MSKRFRKCLTWSLVWMIALFLGVAAFYACGFIRMVGPPDDAYVGWSRSQIEAEWGAPTSECDGHYGNPGLDFEQQYPNAKTLFFERWRGTLYVSIEEEDGEWRCFRSNWLPRGVVF